MLEYLSFAEVFLFHFLKALLTFLCDTDFKIVIQDLSLTLCSFVKFLIVQVNCNKLYYVTVICCLALHTNYVKQSKDCGDLPPATHSRQESVCSLLLESASQFLLFRDSGILSHDFHGFLLKNGMFCTVLIIH